MRIKKSILFIFLFLTVVATAIAQPPTPGGPGGNVDDIPAPIDDHIWLSILVAIAFGIFILKSQKAQTSK